VGLGLESTSFLTVGNSEVGECEEGGFGEHGRCGRG
jgi:hypothetical protein